MKVFRLLGLSALLAVFMGVTGCFDETVDSGSKAAIPELGELLSSLQKVELDIAQGFLLQRSSPRDRDAFKAALYEAEIATLRLQKDPNSQEALSLLYDSYRVYAGLKLQEEDGFRLEELAQTIKRTLDVMAGYQGRTFEGLARDLFVKDFNYELAPFASYSKLGKDGWKKTNFRENHYAGVSGTRLSSWLFSPRFDLSQVDEPSFSLEQAINSRGAAYLSSVSFLVSTDYEGGDPEAASWETLSIERLPDGSGFASVRTEDVSLAAYKGKKVVISFRYDTSTVNSFPTWQITKFRLKGTGDLSFSSLAPLGSEKIVVGEQMDVIYSKKFNSTASETLAPFVPLNRAGTWKMSAYNGKFFAEGRTLVDPADKKKGLPSELWLFSPRLDLGGVEKPSLSLLQTIRADKVSSAISVLVSSDFEGQDPTQANWVPLKISNLPSGTNFTPVESEMVDLSAWQGKAITIAFRVKTEVAEPQLATWQLENFTIFGKGAPLKDLIPTTLKQVAATPESIAAPLSN